MPLPPGQHRRADFPRFGLDAYAHRIPEPAPLRLEVDGQLARPVVADVAALAGVPRVEQVSDLHCVTTWSATGLRWAGWRFCDVWEALIAPHLTGEAQWLLFGSADGFRTRLPLDDALGDDVLLADTLDGEPLPLIHGGPLRFVAPAHYGYKNPKHVTRLTVAEDCAGYRPVTPLRFMEHPRARVHAEERGRWPAWLLRRLYRPLVDRTVRRFAAAWSARAPGQRSR